MAALLTVVAVGMFACKKETNPIQKPQPEKNYYEYAAFHVGEYREYRLDSAHYNGNSNKIFDSSSYFYRETITDKSVLGSDTIYSVKVEQKVNGSYTLVGNYDFIKSPKYLLLRRNNTITCKLIFPIKQGGAWNPESFASGGDTLTHKSFYTAVHSPWRIFSGRSDSSVTVTLQDERDFINRKYEAEVYVKNIGLVRYEKDSLDRQPDQTDTLNRKVRGYTVSRTLTGYGR